VVPADLGKQIKYQGDYLINQRLIDAQLGNELIYLEFIEYEGDKVYFSGYENQEYHTKSEKPLCTAWRSSSAQATANNNRTAFAEYSA